MTQDEILEMVREAGGSAVGGPGWTTWVGTQSTEFLERFAKLVAAKEREACAQACEDLPAPDTYSNTDMSMWDVTCIDCAEAIRARGQA